MLQSVRLCCMCVFVFVCVCVCVIVRVCNHSVYVCVFEGECDKNMKDSLI